MGYVGNQQTEGFSQVPAKQDLTGATGTSLTLTHAVASAEGIDLFINNVRQESGEAYSIAGDGVTVTLTGSVVAADDIYVVYNSLARQTSTHPSNQALQATSGTFSGTVTANAFSGDGSSLTGVGVAGITSSSTSGTAISIDSSNRVSMDSSHVFDMFELTSDITSNQTPISSNLRRVQHAAFASLNGMSLSSGVFTFPFAGLYKIEFFYKSNPTSNDNVVVSCQFTTNNSSYSNATSANCSANAATENSASGIALINVTDTSQVKVRFNAGSITSGSSIKGSSSETITGFVFTRLTDAQ
jgi:hypothetical protein